MDKMNEGSDASAFVKTDVKFWITRKREREEEKGFTYVGAIPTRDNEKQQGGDERGKESEYKRGEIKERKGRKS